MVNMYLIFVLFKRNIFIYSSFIYAVCLFSIFFRIKMESYFFHHIFFFLLKAEFIFVKSLAYCGFRYFYKYPNRLAVVNMESKSLLWELVAR